MAEARRAELRPAVLHLGLERGKLEVEGPDSSSTRARPAPWGRLASRTVTFELAMQRGPVNVYSPERFEYSLITNFFASKEH